MTFQEALEKIRHEAQSQQDLDAVNKLNNKRQVKKFNKGFGRVRELAGLTHTRVAK